MSSILLEQKEALSKKTSNLDQSTKPLSVDSEIVIPSAVPDTTIVPPREQAQIWFFRTKEQRDV